MSFERRLEVGSRKRRRKGGEKVARRRQEGEVQVYKRYVGGYARMRQAGTPSLPHGALAPGATNIHEITTPHLHSPSHHRTCTHICTSACEDISTVVYIYSHMDTLSTFGITLSLSQWISHAELHLNLHLSSIHTIL